MCMLRSLQQVTGEALASILVKIYLQEELNQGQPALVSRASMLGPGLERWRFLHRKTQLLLPSLSTRGSVISYMVRKEETYYCKRKIGFFSPAPHLHLGKWKERWTISISTHVCIHESVYWHSAVCSIKTQTSTHTLFLSLSLSYGGAVSLQNKCFHTALPSKTDIILELAWGKKDILW